MDDRPQPARGMRDRLADWRRWRRRWRSVRRVEAERESLAGEVAAERLWISSLLDGLIDALERGGHELQFSTYWQSGGEGGAGSGWKTTMKCQRCGLRFWGRLANRVGIGLTTKRQCTGSLARLEHYKKLFKMAVEYIAVVLLGGAGFHVIFQNLDSSDRFPTRPAVDLFLLGWAIPVFALFRTGRRRWAWIIAVVIWIVFISLRVAT